MRENVVIYACEIFRSRVYISIYVYVKHCIYIYMIYTVYIFIFGVGIYYICRYNIDYVQKWGRKLSRKWEIFRIYVFVGIGILWGWIYEDIA